MKFLKILFFVISKVTISNAWASWNGNADFSFRTDPRAMNLTGSIAYDQLLRGEASKENPFYSYARLGFIAGGCPSIGAYLDYAPIAPLIFSVQKGYTHRFHNNSRVDCQSYQCQKNVDRTDYSVRGIVAYEKFFFTQNYIWREIKTDEDLNRMYLEQEHFVAPSGFHRFTEANSILGYMISDQQQAGFLYTTNRLSEGGFRSHTASVFFRQKWGDLSLTAGVSQYKNEQFDIEGPAGFISLKFDQGKKLSLF